MTTAPAEYFQHRHAALAAALEQNGLDGFIVSHRPNISYLTGFFGSAGLLLVTHEGLQLFSDARYAEALAQIASQVPGLRTAISAPGEAGADERLVDAITARGLRRVGFEARVMNVRQHVDLSARLRAAGAAVELAASDGLVEPLRVVKDAWEVATLREAGRRLSEVAKCIIPKVLPGLTERDVAGQVEQELRRAGFERPAFDTIIAAGPNGALPHHRAGDRVLAAGDLVVVDFGGVLRGYAVDMTRTVVLGTASERQAACLAAVAAAQQAAFAVSRAGTAPDEVDAVARRVLAERGMEEAFVHGLGHGLGLEVHELPRLTRRRADRAEPPLAAGMVFTLEPGVYFPGWGGVRIEDDVLVTDAGPAWLTDGAGDVRAT